MAKRIILGGLSLLIFILPFPIHTATWESLGLAIPFLTWLFTSLKRKEKPKFYGLGFPILLWVGVVLISLIHSINPVYSLHELKDELFKQLILFLVVVNALKREDCEFLLYPLLLSNFFVSAFTLYGFFTGILTESGRAIGTYLSYSRTAMYYIFSIPLIFTILLSHPKKFLRYVSLFLLTLSLLALLFTYTRGAWICVFFALILLSLRKNWKLSLSILLVTSLLAISVPGVKERVKETFNFRKGLNNILSARIGLWKNALIIIKDNPFTGAGYGPNIFRYLKDKYDITNRISKTQQPDAHNLYLQIMVETGIPGILAFLFLIFRWYQVTLRKWRKLKAGWEKEFLTTILTSIGAILFYGLVGYFYEDRNGLFFWLFLSLALVLGRED